MAEIEDKVLEMYLDGVKVQKICAKLHIGYRRYGEIMRPYWENGLPQRRRGKRKEKRHERFNPLNYSYNRFTGVFTVYHNSTYYGCVRTEKQAKKMVELLRHYDWDKTMAGKCKKIAVREGV